MGRVALPELRRLNYEPALATGTLAAGGTLGILIPPSVVLIVYAIIVEANIVTLFAAALIPGLIAVLFFILTITIYVKVRPHAGRPQRLHHQLARARRANAPDVQGRHAVLCGGDAEDNAFGRRSLDHAAPAASAGLAMGEVLPAMAI
jgi:TRAP-type mannitol/chloroaromatic compound transport system permease large subunit